MGKIITYVVLRALHLAGYTTRVDDTSTPSATLLRRLVKQSKERSRDEEDRGCINGVEVAPLYRYMH